MRKFIYYRNSYSTEDGWDNELFYNEDGLALHTERKCFIESLIKSGVIDLPFDSLSLYGLEVACLANNIYVVFEDQ